MRSIVAQTISCLTPNNGTDLEIVPFLAMKLLANSAIVSFIVMCNKLGDTRVHWPHAVGINFEEFA